MTEKRKEEKILILDVPAIPTDIRKKFQRLGLITADAEELSSKLYQWDRWGDFDPQTTLLVFPGNGASIVRNYLPNEWLEQWQWVGVFTKRHWTPGQDPWVVAHRISNQMVLNIKDVVVVDDVVSSGKTCCSLRKINQPWIPGAKWHVVSWIAQQSASLRGFSSIHSVKRYGAKGKRVPINSLSTLLDDEKIAASFVRRHFPDSWEKFFDLLRRVRKMS